MMREIKRKGQERLQEERIRGWNKARIKKGGAKRRSEKEREEGCPPPIVSGKSRFHYTVR